MCWLSPAPVQKYPIFFGLILLAVKGGVSSGGVGTCKMGSGGALDVKGSVTPGIDGIKGGRDKAEVSAVRLVMTVMLCFIMNDVFERVTIK